MGRRKTLTEEELREQKKTKLIREYVRAVIFADIYKQIEKQANEGKTEIEIDIEQTTVAMRDSIGYSLTEGYTRAGSVVRLSAGKNLIIREDHDFITFRIKENITSTDKKYLRQLSERYEEDREFLLTQIDEEMDVSEKADRIKEELNRIQDQRMKDYGDCHAKVLPMAVEEVMLMKHAKE
jgi:hypothetical protein